jgi:AcrR family transcriptional regulator
VRKRLERLDPEKRERLFDAAAEEFAEHGYDRASLNRILRQAGVGKSSMYYYFEDKADLFSATAERVVGMVMAQIGGFSLEELTRENFWERFTEMARSGVEYFSAHGWSVRFARLFYRLRSQAAGGTGRVFSLIRWWTERTVVRGQELGAVRTDLPLSFVVEAVLALGEAMDRWTLDHWDELSAEERIEESEKQMDLFRRMLEPPAEGAG